MYKDVKEILNTKLVDFIKQKVEKMKEYTKQKKEQMKY